MNTWSNHDMSGLLLYIDDCLFIKGTRRSIHNSLLVNTSSERGVFIPWVISALFCFLIFYKYEINFLFNLNYL